MQDRDRPLRLSRYLGSQIRVDTPYTVIANHSFDAVTFTRFSDAGGSYTSHMCCDFNSEFDAAPLVIASLILPIMCTLPGVPSDIILLTENYNAVHIPTCLCPFIQMTHLASEIQNRLQQLSQLLPQLGNEQDNTFCHQHLCRNINCSRLDSKDSQGGMRRQQGS